MPKTKSPIRRARRAATAALAAAVAVAAVGMFLPIDILAADTPSVAAMRKAAEKRAREEAARDAEADEGGAGVGMILKDFIPAGEPSRMVTIPNLKDGILQSLIKADSITRMDDENLDATGMTIESFNPGGESGLTIELVTATYHMPTGLLESDTETVIRHPEFDLYGDSILYDTKTQQGKLLGNVKMYIYTETSSSNGKGQKQ